MRRSSAVLATALVLAGGALTQRAAAMTGVVTVELTAHWSRWSPAALRVPAGVPVRFVVHNTDPIPHEIIVGDAAVQAAHERGTETHHGARPTEVDLPALATVETTIVFERPGRLEFACHLPGHYAYGMRGVMSVW